MKKSALFLYLVALLGISCTQQSAVTTPKANNSNAKVNLSTSTQADMSTSDLSSTPEIKYTNSLVSSSSTDLTTQDNQVLNSVSNSQGLLNSIAKISKRPVNNTRMDEFYKCNTMITDGFFTPTSTDSSMTNLATQMKTSFVTLSSDALSPKIGLYEPYSVAVDATGMIFVFFTTNSTQDVFYTYQDLKTNAWSTPVSLTKVTGFKGIPTAAYDSTTQKIIVQVFQTVQNKLYIYRQTTGTSFQADATTTAYTQTAFDSAQAQNGSNMEANYNISLNSITPDVAQSSIVTRLMGDVFTLGTAEIASALYKDAQSQAQTVLGDVETTVCPKTN